MTYNPEKYLSASDAVKAASLDTEATHIEAVIELLVAQMDQRTAERGALVTSLIKGRTITSKMGKLELRKLLERLVGKNQFVIVDRGSLRGDKYWDVFFPDKNAAAMARMALPSDWEFNPMTVKECSWTFVENPEFPWETA